MNSKILKLFFQDILKSINSLKLKNLKIFKNEK